jgi:hypothetical protein
MSADDFFSRWSRRAAEAKANAAKGDENPEKKIPDVQAANTQAPVVPEPPREVTLEDVAALTKDSDYSAFVAKGVDEAVKRSAMKKLFADPHFNVMDGLDIYIDDYSVFEPITPAVLAMMEHAKPLLDPLGQLRNSVMSLLPSAEEEKENTVPASQGKEHEPATALTSEEEATMQAEVPGMGTEAADSADPVELQPSAESSSPAKPAE